MAEEIVNRVASSELITLDPADFYPKEEILLFDLKPFLFRELVLREKEFRAAISGLDIEPYGKKIIALTCTNDAIIPVWAYMLAVTRLQPVAREIFLGNEGAVRKELFLRNIRQLDITAMDNRRVVIKGCGDIDLDEAAYVEITKKLLPVAKSIMYGEPCSTVPIYKQKQQG